MAIQLETCEHGIIVRFRDGAGSIQSKIVDPKDVVDALASRSKLDTGLLPRNTRYYARLANYQLIVLEMPEHICRIAFSGAGTPFDVPMPYLVFFIKFVSSADSTCYNVVHTSLFAAYGPVLDSNTMLYRFPFGNVFPGGQVCWGSLPVIETPSLAELAIVPTTILSSKFNSDLSLGNFNPFPDPDVPGAQISRSEHLLRYLHGKPEFDYDILLSRATFGSILKDFTA